MAFETTHYPGVEWKFDRAPAFLAGLILGLVLLGLAWNVDIPQPNHDWNGKTASHREAF